VYEALYHQRFDMIIPTNNGFSPVGIVDFVLDIRRLDPAVKIIVMSGYHPPDLVRQYWEAGIDDFMPLPFSVEDFMARVKKYFTD
jgi:DNA-binding response OmpR family regulator